MLMAIIRVPRWFFRAIVGCVATVVGWLVTAAQTACAQVSASLSGTTLIVTGDGNDNTIDIYVSGNNIVVEADQQTPWTFNKNDVTYIQVYGNAGADYINCNISDADGTAVFAVDLSGGSGSDTIHGSRLDGDFIDYIDGGDDDDFIMGHDGGDFIYGGAGSDTIHGGSGNDTIYGAAGNDCIRGGAGDDELYGGDGNDNLGGQGGNDYLIGNSGNDSLYHYDESILSFPDGHVDTLDSTGVDCVWANTGEGDTVRVY